MSSTKPITTKPKYEEINTSFGSSFKYMKFTKGNKANHPHWHFHPEFELVYIADGNGMRKVGRQTEEFTSGDLVFVGPNVPHQSMTYEIDEEYLEIVVQMKDRFLGKDFFEIPEMVEVKKLFERAKTGLAFGSKTKWEVSKHLTEMDGSDDFGKMTKLLTILQVLAYAKDCNPLNANSLSFEVKQTDQERMNILNSFLGKNYQRKFSMKEVAQEVNMTVPSLCRFFKNLTHRTYMEYANEYRIAIATRLLSQKDLSISAVSFESGFNNLSHFNKQFKQITGQTPTTYRKNLVNFVEAPLH